MINLAENHQRTFLGGGCYFIRILRERLYVMSISKVFFHKIYSRGVSMQREVEIERKEKKRGREKENETWTE